LKKSKRAKEPVIWGALKPIPQVTEKENVQSAGLGPENDVLRGLDLGETERRI